MTRPHCQSPGACPAKKPNGHCRACESARRSADTEYQARRVAAAKAAMATPEWIAGHAERIRKLNANPAYVAKRAAAVSKSMKARHQQPEFQATVRANAMRSLAAMLSPESRAKVQAKKPESSAKQSATKMAWCPPAYRQMYRDIKNSTGLSKAEVQAIVLAQVEHDTNEATRVIAHHVELARVRRERDQAQQY